MLNCRDVDKWHFPGLWLDSFRMSKALIGWYLGLKIPNKLSQSDVGEDEVVGIALARLSVQINYSAQILCYAMAK